jgi:hypothetical protein
MTRNFVARVAGKQAGQLLHAQALKDDERTLMQKSFDSHVASETIRIVSILPTKTGYEFRAEMDAAKTRMTRQGVIVKWGALADLWELRNASGKAARFRRDKAVAAARAVGWTVEFSEYGTRIQRVAWTK